jgi:general secretion pathway protein M
MSPPGRPKGEFRRAKPEGTPVSTRPHGARMNATDAWHSARATLAAFWQARDARERRALLFSAWVLGSFLVWSLAIAPPLRALRSAPAQIEALDARLQVMQSMADEAAVLRAVPPLPPAQAAAALQAAGERLGSGARLSLQGDRAVLSLNAVAPDALRGFVAEARAGARARPIEASLTRGEGGYSGQIVLALGAAP